MGESSLRGGWRNENICGIIVRMKRPYPEPESKCWTKCCRLSYKHVKIDRCATVIPSTGIWANYRTTLRLVGDKCSQLVAFWIFNVFSYGMLFILNACSTMQTLFFPFPSLLLTAFGVIQRKHYISSSTYAFD